MVLRACLALSFLLPACATIKSDSRGRADLDPDPKIANLQRAARLPWVDDGRCAVREASNRWPVLAERCFHVLDHDKVRFQDLTGRCAVAAAPAVAVGIGVCLLAAAEIAAEAVLVVGSVVVGAAIAAELAAAEAARKRRKWCDCYCGKDPTPVLTNTLDFECRSECVLLGYEPTDYVCR